MQEKTQELEGGIFYFLFGLVFFGFFLSLEAITKFQMDVT